MSLFGVQGRGKISLPLRKLHSLHGCRSSQTNHTGIYWGFFCPSRYKITKRRFDAVLKGISELKIHGNIDSLIEQETADVLIVAGMEKDRLWGK